MRNVELSLKIVEEVALRQPIGVSELARVLDLPKTTTQRALLTLGKAGWLEIGEDGRALWSLSLRVLTLGGLAVNAVGRLRAVAIPVMEDLRRSTEETVHLNVYYKQKTVLLERLDGLRPVRVFNAFGASVTLHPTAAGRMLLACMPEADREAYFAGPFPDDRPLTSEGAEVLRRDLPEFLRQGFSLTLGGVSPDVHAVAAPIFGRGVLPVAAISVSAPSDRMPGDRCVALGPVVADAARRISLGLKL